MGMKNSNFSAKGPMTFKILEMKRYLSLITKRTMMLGQPMLASFARQCDNHVFQEPVARFKVRKIFVHNSWSFWVNPLKFGDFSKNLV